jgi:hypothetical protein
MAVTLWFFWEKPGCAGDFSSPLPGATEGQGKSARDREKFVNPIVG